MPDPEEQADESTAAQPKAPPPAFEDRVTVDPHPPGVDADHAHEKPDFPDDGPESRPEGDGG